MKLGYIQTFAELTQNKNIVSEQELMAFQNKYNLAEKEMDEIKEYCIEHDIMIFYAEDFDVKDVSHRIQTAGTYLPKTERRRIIRTIASEIVHKGVVRARKRTSGRGWLCGTYACHKMKIIERRVAYGFTDEEIEFIKSHLPENSDEAEFALLDPEKQAQCDEMSQKLNALIPRIHLNLFLSDFMDD